PGSDVCSHALRWTLPDWSAPAAPWGLDTDHIARLQRQGNLRGQGAGFGIRVEDVFRRTRCITAEETPWRILGFVREDRKTGRMPWKRIVPPRAKSAPVLAGAFRVVDQLIT